jgi:hypothetical protein
MIVISSSSAVTVILSLLMAAAPAPASSYLNIYGNELPSCSQDSMALSGSSSSNGYCVDEYDDQGTRHICIDLSTNSGLCEATVLSDGCVSEMPCHGNTAEYCPVQNWCVGQWTFAVYIETAGGCDQIQDIICESINVQAIRTYKSQQGKNSSAATALSCLANRCGLVISNTTLFGMPTDSMEGTQWVLTTGVTAMFIGGGLAAACWIYRTVREPTEPGFDDLLVPESPDDKLS